jgi:hypothetical protein
MRSVLVEGSLIWDALQGESPSDFDLLWKVLQSAELRGYITQEDLDRIYVDITRTQGIESATHITYHIKRVLSVYAPETDLAPDVRIAKSAIEQSSTPEGMTTLSVSGFLERFTLDLIYREQTPTGRVQQSLAHWFRKSSDLGFDLLVIPLLFTLVLQGLGVAGKVWAAPTSEPDPASEAETTSPSETIPSAGLGTHPDLSPSPLRSLQSEASGDPSQAQTPASHSPSTGAAEFYPDALEYLLTLLQGPTRGVDFQSLRLTGTNTVPHTISSSISTKATPLIASSSIDASALDAKMTSLTASGTVTPISTADRTQSSSEDDSKEQTSSHTVTTEGQDTNSVEFNVNVEVDGSSVNITVGPSSRDNAKVGKPQSNDPITSQPTTSSFTAGPTTDQPLLNSTSDTPLREVPSSEGEGVEFVWRISPESTTVELLLDDSAEQVMDNGAQPVEEYIHDHGFSAELPTGDSQAVSHLNSEPQIPDEWGTDSLGTDPLETDRLETDPFGLQVVVSGEDPTAAEIPPSQPLTPTTLVATILEIKEQTPLGFELAGSFVGAGDPNIWYQEFIELAQDPLGGLGDSAVLGINLLTS